MLDSGTDLAETRVEFALPVMQFRTAIPFEQRIASIDPYSLVRGSAVRFSGIFECGFQAGRLECIGVVPCAVHRNRPDRGYVADQITAICKFMPANLLPGKQVGWRGPVPRRADSAVYQGSSPASQHLRRVGTNEASALPITGRRRSISCSRSAGCT